MKTPNDEDVMPLVEIIKPLLAGWPPQIQGAVLADLLATWLAGHHISGDAELTRAMRAELLAEHCQLVWELVPLNAWISGTSR